MNIDMKLAVRMTCQQVIPPVAMSTASWWSFQFTIPCLNGRCSVNKTRASGAKVNALPHLHAI